MKIQIPAIAMGAVCGVTALYFDDKKVDHHPRHEPQPIADQIMAGCICGWRKPVSLHDHQSRDDLWGAVGREYDNHLT
jgi:hypothetical protein